MSKLLPARSHWSLAVRRASAALHRAGLRRRRGQGGGRRPGQRQGGEGTVEAIIARQVAKPSSFLAFRDVTRDAEVKSAG
ncbi:hypothetical protein ACPA9J_07715 [Pseudomonas aeruginosa]